MRFDAFWIAHRGGGGAPENTLAAFRHAYAAGFRAFECDVQVSRDGIPFLLHDATLQRTSDGRGVAARQPWSRLRRLHADRWRGRLGGVEPLPRLDAVLAFAAARRAWLNLELKPAPGEARRVALAVAREVARWRRRHPDAPPPLLSSFSIAALRAARGELARMRSPLPLALLADTFDAALIDRALRLGAAALHLHWRAITPARARAIQDAGLQLRAYTVNRAASAARLRALGVSGVFTDRVDLPAR